MFKGNKMNNLLIVADTSVDSINVKRNYKAIIQTDLYCNYVILYLEEDENIHDTNILSNKDWFEELLVDYRYEELFDWRVNVDLEPSTSYLIDWYVSKEQGYYDFYPEYIPTITKIEKIVGSIQNYLKENNLK